MRQATEKTQLDDLSQSRIQLVEPRQRFVDAEQLIELGVERRFPIAGADGKADVVSAPLEREVSPGERDEHLSHRPRRRAEKMGAVVPRDAFAMAESEERLVNELRRADRRAAAHHAQMAPSHSLELVVDDRE